MATKKPTAKQLAARKKFAQMAKDGTLTKKRAAAAKKKDGLNSSLPKGMTKVVAQNIKVTGLSKVTGRLLKGYRYAAPGKVVKVTPKKK